MKAAAGGSGARQVSKSLCATCGGKCASVERVAMADLMTASCGFQLHSRSRTARANAEHASGSQPQRVPDRAAAAQAGRPEGEADALARALDLMKPAVRQI